VYEAVKAPSRTVKPQRRKGSYENVMGNLNHLFIFPEFTKHRGTTVRPAKHPP
jgi:hypothetical protein